MILKLYADESLDSSTSLMNVSGYLMTEEQFTALDQAVIEARGEMPYFHMKEGHHVEHPEIYRKLVSLVDSTSVLCGFCASLYINDHKELTSSKLFGHRLSYWMGKEYVYALGELMALASECVDRSKYRESLIAYVFENGHPNQGDANTFWSQLSKPHLEDLKIRYRYASHTFVDGKGPLGSVLQLCDILAWNINRARREGKESPELLQLLQTDTYTTHHGKEEIFNVVQGQIERWKTIDSKGKPRAISVPHQ